MLNKWFQFYFSFKGRATRYDFNMRFALVAFVGAIIAGILDVAVNGGNIMRASTNDPFSTFWNLVVIIPMFAITCRRLHDMNHSGWWQLIVFGGTAVVLVMLIITVGIAMLADPMAAGFGGFIAVLAVLMVNLVFLLLLSLKRGTVGQNKYGLDPLEVEKNVSE